MQTGAQKDNIYVAHPTGDMLHLSPHSNWIFKKNSTQPALAAETGYSHSTTGHQSQGTRPLF